jgi:tetratricopeptide (TPR) repeat protein
MADDPWDDLCSRLAPEVRTFARAQFELAHDLRRLLDVRRVGAAEAAIFYAARILEVLAGAALHAVNMPPTSNLFGNLDLLERYNLIPAAARYGAHALRRQGNEVRHLGRAATSADAELAIGFAQVVLHWFFCALPLGHQLPALTDDGLPLGMSRDEDFQDLLAALGHDGADVVKLADRCLAAGEAAFTWTPIIPAILVERLLDRKECGRAWAVLEQAGRVFPDDLRLRQLMGLYFSRTGRLDEAVRCLEALDKGYAEDEETIGILAGAYKRRWQADRSQTRCLRMAHKLYRTGWEKSKRLSAYLGINAATTALLLRQSADTRRIAADVLALFDDRAAGVAGHRAAVIPGFWDQVTRAEAQLLLGQRTAAAQSYRDAYQAYPNERAGIEVSRGQAAEILRVMGCTTNEVEQFLAATTS